ncbi:MAG: complex I NDUFA9 subunit family protein [Nitrospirae bacterium]|nr:complex I NDUFA9 subunit family protein [Nitrospirota bacterium]
MDKIFIAGGTGFIGRHLVSALREDKYDVRCLVRTPEKAELCKAQGFESVIGELTDRESLKGALDGCSMVIHLIGIIEEKGTQTFKAVHVEGTRNLLDVAKKQGIKHFFYQSALGADLDSWAGYLRTKAQAEELIKGSGIPFTIFRPSIVVGENDGFTKKIKDMIASLSPLIAVPGKGKARFQPIYVKDWVRCFFKIIDNPDAIGKTYSFGGTEQLTYKEIVQAVASAMGSQKPIVHIPSLFVKLTAPVLGIVTVEQIRLLDVDNICDPESVKKNFGFEPMTFKDALRLFISL